MHLEAIQFTYYIKICYPSNFVNCNVLDVGAGDINGNNSSLFTDCKIEANDVIQAKNVTIVSKTKDLVFKDNTFDTIISTECFEHDPEYKESLKNIYRMLKPGGLFVFTCASTGRPEHGTRRTTPHDSYGTIGGLEEMIDYYKNLTIYDVNEVLPLKEYFSLWDSYYNDLSKDLYFFGFKKQENINVETLIKRKYSKKGVIQTGIELK